MGFNSAFKGLSYQLHKSLVNFDGSNTVVRL